jgi:hypothetical protein
MQLAVFTKVYIAYVHIHAYTPLSAFVFVILTRMRLVLAVHCCVSSCTKFPSPSLLSSTSACAGTQAGDADSLAHCPPIAFRVAVEIQSAAQQAVRVWSLLAALQALADQLKKTKNENAKMNAAS